MINEQKQNGVILRFAELDSPPAQKMDASFFIKTRNPFARLDGKKMTFDEYMAFKDTIFETISQLAKYPNVSSNYINSLALYQMGNDKISLTPEQARDWSAFCRKMPEVLETELAKSPAALEYVQIMRQAPLEAYCFRDNSEKTQLQKILQQYDFPVVFLEKDVSSVEDWAMLNRAMLMTISLNPAVQFDISNVSLTLEFKNSSQAENLRIRTLYESFRDEASESQIYPQIAREIGLIDRQTSAKLESSSPKSLRSQSSTTQIEEWDQEIPDLSDSTLDLNNSVLNKLLNNNMSAQTTVALHKEVVEQQGLFSGSHIGAKLKVDSIAVMPPKDLEALSITTRTEKRKTADEQKKAMHALSQRKVRVESEPKAQSGLFFHKEKSPIAKSRSAQTESMQRLSTPRAQDRYRSDKENENNKGAPNVTRPKMRS